MATYILDFKNCRIPSYAHQRLGTRRIFENKWFFIADEMGAGKTKQAIDAAQFLFQYGFIDKVIVVAPAPVRTVWFDAELGELSKHLWISQAGRVTEFHAHSRSWIYGDQSKPRLQWIVTNYEFIRAKARQQQLLQHCTERTLLILDESIYVKNYRAQQTIACLTLRHRCGRVLLLNGTPIANNPGDLFSQCNIMHPTVLNCKNWWVFRARYGVLGGWKNKQIVKWVNIDDLQRRMAPYILRRLKKDCLDLPDKIPPVVIPFNLTERTWKIYKEMRDDFVAWVSSSNVSMAQQAITKSLRLSQITSGFLGGVENQDYYDAQDTIENDDKDPPLPIVEEIGTEKLDAFLMWYRNRMEAEPNLKLIVWCRFRPEAMRLMKAIEALEIPGLHTGMIIGSQKKALRAHALRLLDPRTAPDGPVTVVGTTTTGKMGMNLTASHDVVYMSNDYSMMIRQQSEDRVHRPGQVHKVNYFDFVATGPQGQKTIDHHKLKVLSGKEDLATMTMSAWVQTLTDDRPSPEAVNAA